MDLKFTDEQNMLRDMTHQLCVDFSTPEVVRSMENDPQGIPTTLWEKMSEAGLFGILIPEEHGGMGLSMLDGVIAYEQLGRYLAPGPYFASSVACGGAILQADAAGRSELLAAIASGECIVVPAWLEADRGFGPEGVQLSATASGSDFILDGAKRHVFNAAAAKHLLVLARTGTAPTDIDLFLVDTDAPGVTLEQQLSMASDTQYKATFNQVKVSAAQRVGPAGSGWKAWEAAMYDGIILLAAFAAGGAARALEMTVEYTKTREQFGKPIGAFQALSHYMADADAEIEGAKMLVLEAAWARSNDKPDVLRLASMAKLIACNTFRSVTNMAQQVHGGIGFTLDYDIQLFYRRAKQLQMNWWDKSYLEELIAIDVLDTDRARTIPDPFTV